MEKQSILNKEVNRHEKAIETLEKELMETNPKFAWLIQLRIKYHENIKKLEKKILKVTNKTTLKQWMECRIKKYRRYLYEIEAEILECIQERQPKEDPKVNKFAEINQWLGYIKKIKAGVPEGFQSEFETKFIEAVKEATKYKPRYRRRVFNDYVNSEAPNTELYQDYHYLDIYESLEQKGVHINLNSFDSFSVIDSRTLELHPILPLKLDLRSIDLTKRFESMESGLKDVIECVVGALRDIKTDNVSTSLNSVSMCMRSSQNEVNKKDQLTVSKWLYDLICLFQETKLDGLGLNVTVSKGTVEIKPVTSVEPLNESLQKFIGFVDGLKNKITLLEENEEEIVKLTYTLAHADIVDFIDNALMGYLKNPTCPTEHDLKYDLIQSYQDNYQMVGKVFTEEHGYSFNMNKELLFTEELESFSALVDVVLCNKLTVQGGTLGSLEIKV